VQAEGVAALLPRRSTPGSGNEKRTYWSTVMPRPKGWVEQKFAAKNGFNPNTKWDVNFGIEANSREGPGFCLCMVCNWIKISLQLGIENSSKVMEPRQLLFATIVQSGYLQLSRTHTGFKSRSDRKALVLDQYRLNPIFTLKTKEDTSALGYQNLTKKMEELRGSNGSAMPLVFFELHVPEHSIGMARDRSSETWYMFDPNYGLFKYAGETGFNAAIGHMFKTYREKDSEFFILWTAVGLKS
jgi:hypothetical protein